MRKLSRRPSPAMVVALVALCSSLAAGATAATLVTSKDIKNGTITRKDIKKNAVTSKQVKNRTLVEKDFKRGLLGGAAAGTAIKQARAGSLTFSEPITNDNTPTDVVSLTVTAPSDGFLELDYGATFDNPTPNTWLNVYVMEGNTRLNGAEFWEQGDNDGNQDETQRNNLVVPVTKGSHTYSLRLQTSAGETVAHDARMTALFVPSSL